MGIAVLLGWACLLAAPAQSPPRGAPPQAARRVGDSSVTRTQEPGVDTAAPGPSELPPLPPPAFGPADDTAAATESISLQAALTGTLSGNPDLINLRRTTAATAEAVEVARRFPVALNPTLWVDVRPFVYERVPRTGNTPPYLDQKDAFMYFSWRQPVELGHQTRYRYKIAQAAYSQAHWTQLQAELTALVQTYRLFQTAAYRRERMQVAQRLATFSERISASVAKRVEANQLKVDEAALAEVEREASVQAIEVARQDYVTALADLQNQIGVSANAGRIEPLGEFVLPSVIPVAQDQALEALAISARPDIMAARAQLEGARAAVALARGDRIPTPVIGPVYQRNEGGAEFFGFVYITPIPVLNSGKPLVRQRLAEERQAEQRVRQFQERAATQVRAAVARWNGATRLVSRTSGLTDALIKQVNTLERLFEEGESDLTKLLQAQQRLIQLENARLDAVWAATQAQADLLLAVGTPALLSALHTSEMNRASATPAR